VSKKKFINTKKKNECSIKNENNVEKDELTKFFENFFAIDLVPVEGIQLQFKNKKFFLEKDEIADIILILVNAYNKYASVNTKLKFDREELLKSKLYHLVEAQIRKLRESSKPKEVESLMRQYAHLKKRDFKITSDLKVFEKCMRELKPDITFGEIYALIKKHSKEDE
jgi:hypothetical protein